MGPLVASREELEWFLRVLDVCDEIEACRTDTLRLMSHMKAVDERDGSTFSFEHLRVPLAGGEVELGGDGYTLRSVERSWRWQRWVAEQVIARSRLIFLKGRQIGVTWVVLAVDVAEAIQQPGTTSLLYRQREDEAIDNVQRWWSLYQSLPAFLREGHEVQKPIRTDQPGRDGIHIKFPGGKTSKIVPMTSAAASGHGRSTRHIMLDEGGYIEKLEAICAAVEPAAGRARISIISTANGRSNPETGDGNEFHRRWVDTGSGYFRLFLPYDVHPDRDVSWYESAPEIRSLKPYQRHAQFPRNANEAFALSDRTFFEVEDLQHYQERVRVPLYRADFVDDADRSRLARGAKARLRKWSDEGAEVKPNQPHGLTRIYEEPVAGTRYAIGADPATGRGLDYSVAYVVNLSTMAFAAEFHGRLDEDLFAAQLHYLGRMYGRDVPADPKDPGSQPGFAKLAIENAVGHGAAVIAALRDRIAGRPAYGNLYRHRLDNRADKPEAKPWGFPMNQATRPKVLNQLDAALRERALPYTTATLQSELEDFIEHDSGTTPRARDGAHDDCVLSAAIALEMFRQYGTHAAKPRLKPRRRGLIGLGRAA